MARSHRPISRTAAKRGAYVAQAAAALLTVGAVAAFAIKPAEAPPAVVEDVPPPPIDPALLNPNQDDPVAIDTGAIDFAGIAERLKLVSNAPTPAEIPDEPDDVVNDDNGDDDDRTRESSLNDRVTFAGAITQGSRKLALLRVDGVQRFGTPGSVVRGSGSDDKDPVTVVRVDDDSVLVRAGSQSAEIEKQDTRVAATVTALPETVASSPKTTRDPRTSPASQPGAFSAREEPSVGAVERESDQLQRRLDSINRLEEQGRIDAERAEMLRQRAIEQLERQQTQQGINPGDRNR